MLSVVIVARQSEYGQYIQLQAFADTVEKAINCTRVLAHIRGCGDWVEIIQRVERGSDEQE